MIERLIEFSARNRLLVLLAMEQGAIAAEARGQRRIDEVRRIGRAHLEQDALRAFAQHRAVEGAHHVDQRVAPHQHVHADGGAVAQDRGEVLGRCWTAAAAKTVVVVRPPQVAEALQAVDHQVMRRAIVRRASVTCGDQLRQFR